MKLRQCEAWNFGSYEHFQFDFSDVGLALIYGATGSGKSTFQDVPCWVLFGKTAKDVAADDVKSWTASGPTKGVMTVEMGQQQVVITRIRGSKSELFFTVDGAEPVKGKDVTDTQKKLEGFLGVTFEQYVAASYFHEFSPTGSFFIAKAKDRRELFENLTDLQFPTKLTQNASQQRKALKDEAKVVTGDLERARGRLEQLERSVRQLTNSMEAWNNTQKALIADLSSRSKSFEVDKSNQIKSLRLQLQKFVKSNDDDTDRLIAEIEAAESKVKESSYFQAETRRVKEAIKAVESKRCRECGGVLAGKEKDALVAEYHAIVAAERENSHNIAQIDSLKRQLGRTTSAINPYDKQLAQVEAMGNHFEEQLKAEVAKANPFKTSLIQEEKNLVDARLMVDQQTKRVDELNEDLHAMEQLMDLSGVLRAKLVERAISTIERNTNDILEEHFDAELRVKFTAKDSDDLEVEITKSGNLCSYKQLSKGQRQLLKLSFSISVMAIAANSAGTHFDCLLLDEALDGLDTDLKLKAFGLFQELEKEHGSVLVIDHNDALKSEFDKRYVVRLEGDNSVIEEQQ